MAVLSVEDNSQVGWFGLRMDQWPLNAVLYSPEEPDKLSQCQWSPLEYYYSYYYFIFVIITTTTSTIWLCCILFQTQSPVTLEITPAIPLLTALPFSSTLFVSIQYC